MPHTALHHSHRHSPWPMLIALVASTPAFYDSLMPSPATWAVGLYVLSGLVVLGSAWYERRLAGRAPVHRQDTHSWGMTAHQERLDWVLGVALLLTAMLPESQASMPALVWRTALALLMLYRLVRISMPLLQQTGLARLLLMASAVLGLCGVGFYWIDPAIQSVPEGLWLAFSTAATVGYGVMSLVTASIAAMFVGTQERQVEREILRNMHAQLRGVRQEIAELRDAVRAAHPPSDTQPANTPPPD